MDPTVNGLLVLDKPSGITSRAAVDRAQAWFPRKTRIGHTGTLDPLASGVLVLCIGAATRLSEYIQRMPKAYRAGITLGATSDTDDADGTLAPTLGADIPRREKVEQELAAFRGEIDQIPPLFSAAKVQGRRAYALARKGKEFELAPRAVKIHEIELIRYDYPHLEIVVRCGKGTYIRSLARDLGQRLGCGGYIDALRRLSIGAFTDTEAISLDVDRATAHARLLPVWRAVQDTAPLTLADADTAKLACGQRIAAPAGLAVDHEFVVTDQTGGFLAVVTIVEGWMQPRKVLYER